MIFPWNYLVDEDLEMSGEFLDSEFERRVRAIVKAELEAPVEVEIKLLLDARMPSQTFEADAAWDLYVLEDTWVRPGVTTEVLTGVYIDIPEGFEVELKPRSGWGKRGLVIHHGTIDAGYHGEVSIFVHNWTPQRFELVAGDRIAQLCLRRKLPIVWKVVEEFTPSERGTRGFGSSGR